MWEEERRGEQARTRARETGVYIPRKARVEAMGVVEEKALSVRLAGNMHDVKVRGKSQERLSCAPWQNLKRDLAVRHRVS